MPPFHRRLVLLVLPAGCSLALAIAPAADAHTAKTHGALAAARHHRCAEGQRAHPCRRRGHSSRAGLRAARAAARARIARERAVAISAALADPCANSELRPSPEDLQLVREAVLCLINRERAQHGELPLRLNASLVAAAEGHCAEMIAEDYFEHVSPDGLTPAQRIREQGYIPNPRDGYVIGENLAWATYQLSTPQAIVAAWLASPPHLANILEARYTETGVGVVASVPASLSGGAPGGTFAQEFGVLIRG